jgi:chromosome partitioning protein
MVWNMAISVSLINMKGGVGKTTLAMQLALAADQRNYKVLAVDLDPQSNLSQAVMGAKAYVQHLDENKPTVVQIFDGYLPSSGKSSSPSPVSVDDVIVKGVGSFHESTLDLIPSRLELSQTLRNPTGKERRLAKALAKIADRYELIVVDCAPTDSILTDAAYFASRYVLVPIKPEFMATIGLPLLARSLKNFKNENEDHQIDICGIVFNHSSSYSSGPEGRQSVSDVTKIANAEKWNIFETHVTYSTSYAKAARERSAIGYTSYVRAPTIQRFRAFRDEFFGSIGLPLK